MKVGKMRICVFLIVLLFILLLVFSSIAPAQSSLSWSVQTVDNYGAAVGNGYCPIALDLNNTIHIAYTDWNESTVRQFPYHFVMHASWNGKGWSIQQVSDGNVYSLVLDVNGNPHILYLHGYTPSGPSGLMYASWTGSRWTSQTVDSKGAGYGMIALDSLGTPHVAYTDGASIKYAILKGSTWSIQTVATYKLGDIDFRLSFVLDKNDTPYIMYSPSSYADYSQAVGLRAMNVTLVTYQNSSWKVQPLSLPTPTGDYGNMVVDSKGYLHSVFTQHYVNSENTTRGTILYATWTGSIWSTQTVFSNISLPYSMSLALDSRDHPHIFVSSKTYASWTGTAWNIQPLNLNRSNYGPIYLALDSSCNPHISYRQATPSQVIANIIYATATTSKTVSQTVPDSVTLTVGAVLITVIVVVVAYIWKKKTNPKLKT